MTSATVSPVFAGREDELALLMAAFDAAVAGTPGIVLVGGEAGGGKSRLAGELAGRVRDRALVLTGGCVELSAVALPYAPFVAVLRELVRERGAAAVAGLLPGPGAGELAALLPGFGPPPGTDPETARVRLFELLLALLETLAEQQPVVLVVEDVHWADRDTRDLLSFLARNLRQAAVLLVVTFRSGGQEDDHALRRLLAGLERMDTVTRIELPPLSRGQVTAQIEGILGHRPDPPSTRCRWPGWRSPSGSPRANQPGRWPPPRHSRHTTSRPTRVTPGRCWPPRCGPAPRPARPACPPAAATRPGWRRNWQTGRRGCPG